MDLLALEDRLMDSQDKVDRWYEDGDYRPTPR